MAKQIIVNVVFAADGSMDRAATDKEYNSLCDKLSASIAEDFSTVAVDITTFLLTSPGLKTIPTSSLVRAVWELKIERGDLKGKSHEEKSALYSRIEEVVPEYVKANPDMFHMGRKTGIAIRYVPGDQAVDAKGEPLFDDKGEPVQAFRHTDEEWSKLTASKAEKQAAASAN